MGVDEVTGEELISIESGLTAKFPATLTCQLPSAPIASVDIQQQDRNLEMSGILL